MLVNCLMLFPSYGLTYQFTGRAQERKKAFASLGLGCDHGAGGDLYRVGMGIFQLLAANCDHVDYPIWSCRRGIWPLGFGLSI